MGTVLSKAASGVGTLLGNAFTAPFKTVFGGSCEGICAGTWDIVCFIEHLCVSNLVKLLMVFGLCYITLMLVYLMFKVGIFKCIGRSIYKMCWAGCETYWHALGGVACFVFRKLKNTKRVNRRRRRRYRDIEVGYSSSDRSDSDDQREAACSPQHKLPRERRRRRSRNSGRLLRQRSRGGYFKHRHHHRHRHCHLKLKNRQLSGRLAGRKLHIQKLNNHRRVVTTSSKRRRLR